MIAVPGLMQDRQLTTGMIIDHAARNHGDTEIVSRGADGRLERSTWAEVAINARRIASAFRAHGAVEGDRIATLAWNRTPHLELYFGVTAAGMVLHTVNPRLFPEQIRYILEHGGARILCIDPDLLPLYESLGDELTTIETVVILCDSGAIPAGARDGLIAYGDLIAGHDPLTDWPAVEEAAACSLCYTSGTTGNPKGVLYSHRSVVLHALSCCTADAMALSALDSVLLVTPLFHVNAWGVPFSSAIAGAKLVLPGASLDGRSLFELLRDEAVTFSLGVPTIWFALLDYIADHVRDQDFAALAFNRVFIGGAAVPATLIEWFRDMLGVQVLQAWGMTETSPVATVCRPLAKHAKLDAGETVSLLASQGRALFGVELRIDRPDGALPQDGTQSGLLKVRGPWVLNAYFGSENGSVLDEQGWFDTGDIAWMDADGFVHITDRAKDVIKSGGEWISSIDLENAANAHPAVAEAAVIGVPHPRWQERPIMLVRLREGTAVEADMLREHLAQHVARWWLPDAILCVEELPHTATGKLLKTALRDRYRDHFASI